MVVFRADDAPNQNFVLPKEQCNHGIKFDLEEAERVLGDWQPKSGVEFVMGNPASAEIKKRWPRLSGLCPLGCGYSGIYYASYEHYIMGDW